MLATPESYAVRAATREDEGEVFELSLLAHKESGLFTPSVPKFNKFWDNYENSSDVIIGVIGDVGAIQGLIILTKSSLWYTETEYLTEIFMYVKPEFRASDNAKKLLAFSKFCADELMMTLFIGVMSGDKLEAKTRLYRRQFGEPFGNYFKYSPKGIRQ